MEREKNTDIGKEKKEFTVKLTEKQQLEGVSMVRSNTKCGCYERSEGRVCYYQSAVNMIKILEQLLAHNDLLNENIKEKSFKIRATAKECAPAKRIEATESND